MTKTENKKNRMTKIWKKNLEELKNKVNKLKMKNLDNKFWNLFN
jgi:hypothetical protein